MPKLSVVRLQDAVERMLVAAGDTPPAPPADIRAALAAAGSEPGGPALAGLLLAAVRLAVRFRVPLPQAFAAAGMSIDLADLGDWRGAVPDDLDAAVAAAAATVSYYDTGRPPAGGDLTPLRSTLPTIIRLAAAGFAGPESLWRHVDGILRAPASGGRWADPAGARSLAHFRPIQTGTFCPFAARARLWGSPDYDPARSLEDNLAASLPVLESFIRVAAGDGLDAFIYAVPVAAFGASIDDLSTMFGRFMRFFAPHMKPGTVDAAVVLDENWRPEILGEQFFLSVFGPRYPHSHPRHAFGADDWYFIMMTPDSTFHALIPEDGYDERIDAIRLRFQEGFQAYRIAELPADQYLLPPVVNTEPVRWYDDVEPVSAPGPAGRP